MSYCPEHGDKMVCRNPDDYDGLVYDCPGGHVIVYANGSYWEATHPDFVAEVPGYCGCGHTDLRHEISDDGYKPCVVCECEDFSLPEDDGLTKGGYAEDALCHELEDSPHHTQAVAAESPPSPTEPQGMEDGMVVRGSQLIAKEYAATMEPQREAQA